MLKGIRSYLESPDLEDDPSVRLDSFEVSATDGVLWFSVMDHAGTETWRRWRVRAKGMLDYEFREPYGELSVHGSEHVLVRQHAVAQQVLMFRGVPRSVPEVVGALVAAHCSVVGSWIPFGRSLNQEFDLESLLAGGFGKLAQGPCFLMEAYAKALELRGVTANLLPPRRSVQWKGGQWAPIPDDLNVVVLGHSYVVAEAFEESPEQSADTVRTGSVSPRR